MAGCSARRMRGLAQPATVVAAVVVGGIAWQWATQPAAAIPLYARQYNLACVTCHISPPRLNEVGLAFRARGYRFDDPGLAALHRQVSIPVSGIATGRYDSLPDADTDEAYFLRLELISGGPLGDGGAHYFVEWLPINKALSDRGAFRVRSGRFEDLWVALPLGGPWSVRVGQERAYTLWDASQRMTVSTPLALTAKNGGFAISDRRPGVRLEFRAPGEESPADVFVAGAQWMWRGEFGFGRDGAFDLNDSEGLFLDAAWRRGLTAYGVYYFRGEGGHTIWGPVALYGAPPLLVSAAAGWADAPADDTRLTAEAEYFLRSLLHAFARYDRQTGAADKVIWSFGLSRFWPLPGHDGLRVTLELRQETGNDAVLLEVNWYF